MYIEEINLENFRNYDNQSIKFNNNVNVIYGNNAQGKTNIIESIFLCSYGKSFRTNKDKELIKFDKTYSSVEILYKKTDREGKIRFSMQDKKVFFYNDIKQTKISDIVGKINIITFTPDDIEIIKDGPDKRRRFLDMMISSLKPNYIHLLNSYNKILEERNNFIKQYKIDRKNESLFDIFDEQLADYSYKIYEYRKYYIDKIAEKINNIHNLITNSNEVIKITYITNSRNKEKFLENIKKNRFNDIQKGYTTIGIHRDDFKVFIDNKSVSEYGSQGQKRTITLTLKFCELEIVKEEINDSPILLLDDFMSELDENRRKNFLENIYGNQVIITCTDKIKLDNVDYDEFYVENGIVNKIAKG